MTEFCGIPVASNILLAPMAGITDAAFRHICSRHGAALTYTEMVSCKALVYGDKKTEKLLYGLPGSAPCIAQIFGSDPDFCARGARIALELSNAPAIDINMGCPMPKITCNGEGSALMLDSALASRVIEAVVKAVNVPVTVKFRAGFYENEHTAVEFARMAQGSGASALCVHGRTRAQMYTGTSSRRVIADVKRAVSIPVIASGDALSGALCAEILNQTGADGIMIARGALGYPLIFADCAAVLDGKAPQHSADELLDALELHAVLSCDAGGTIPELRKHALWYIHRIYGAKKFKDRVARVVSMTQLSLLIDEIRAEGLRLKPTAGSFAV